MHYAMCMPSIVENIVVTDDVHFYWDSVEAFPEFQQLSTQHATTRHWNVFNLHAIPALLYYKFGIPYSL